MAISAVQTYLSSEEYITLERKAIPTYDTVRSEYVKGKISRYVWCKPRT